MKKSTIEFNGVTYPTREILVPDFGWRTISTHSLNFALCDIHGDYRSDAAQAVDEQIFFFVPDDYIGKPDAELVEFVVGSL